MTPAPSIRTTLTRFSIIFVLVFIGLYGLFEARRLIKGPSIVIESPKNGAATSSSAIIISGNAQNISFLTINDKPAFTDESGHFSLLVSPTPGYTVFTVAATDRFGRHSTQSVAITSMTYCPLS